jgi:uncharacterized coiled-coil protein SlyX
VADNNEVISIDKMISKFKTELEFKTYCEIQFKTITKLNKAIVEKDAEIEHLKSLLVKTSPLLEVSDSGILTESTDEEQICRTQLRRLRDLSMSRELTLEETKKAEIFAKLLNGNIKVKDDKDETTVRNMSSEDLLKLVDGK